MFTVQELLSIFAPTSQLISLWLAIDILISNSYYLIDSEESLIFAREWQGDTWPCLVIIVHGIARTSL